MLHRVFRGGIKISCVLAACFFLSAGEYQARAEMSDTVKDGAGGALIGALAGSFGGKAGMGALAGGGIGLVIGAMSDSSRESEKNTQSRAVQDAYQQGLRDGNRVNYNGDADSRHINKFGDDLKD
ncbi:MAG: hypothetical protein ABH883_05550 [Candidatus Omnitrophota bacterium]